LPMEKTVKPRLAFTRLPEIEPSEIIAHMS